jgi:hypothetical protein
MKYGIEHGNTRRMDLSLVNGDKRSRRWRMDLSFWLFVGVFAFAVITQGWVVWCCVGGVR